MYGTPSIAAGRVLDDASKKILAEKLEKALAAASADKAVCERIQRDKEILEGLVAKRKDYQDVQKMQLTIGQVKAHSFRRGLEGSVPCDRIHGHP